MWCHESNLQRGDSDNSADAGDLDYAGFAAELDEMESLMATVRSESGTVLDFEDWQQVHTDAERLVEGYLSPTSDRLALEWGVSTEQVAQWMSQHSLETHKSEEYPELGILLEREQIDAAAPQLALDVEGLTDFVPIPILYSARDLDLDAVDALGDSWALDALVECGL
jgi:hypothetical protein